MYLRSSDFDDQDVQYKEIKSNPTSNYHESHQIKKIEATKVRKNTTKTKKKTSEARKTTKKEIKTTAWKKNKIMGSSKASFWKAIGWIRLSVLKQRV